MQAKVAKARRMLQAHGLTKEVERAIQRLVAEVNKE